MKIQKKKREKIIKYFIVFFLLYFFFHFYFCYLDTQELKYHWELQIILTKRIGQVLLENTVLPLPGFICLSRKASDKAITKVSVKLERCTRANIFAYKNVGFFLFKTQKFNHLVQHNKHIHRKVLLSSFDLNITTVWNKWTVPHEIISAFLALSAFFS